MAKEVAYVWVCELADCGHRWLAVGEAAPEKCAKCRRRGWNAGRSEAAAPSSPPVSTRRSIIHRKRPIKEAAAPESHVMAAGQTRNSDRAGYDHAVYMSLSPSDQLRYLREHPRT